METDPNIPCQLGRAAPSLPSALSKIRAGGRGREYAMRQLRALGTPPECPGKDAATSLRRVFESDVFVRFRHPGNTSMR